MSGPVNPNPEKSHYELIGGEAALRALVDHFYDLMDSLPEVAPLRAMHPEDLASSRDKLFMFLSGWFGGPQLYLEQYGHPRLRGRHMPFAVDADARDQWMMCMTRALESSEIPEAVRAQLTEAFYRTADFMRNQPEDGMPK